MGRQEALIPARFLLTLGNAIVLLMAIYHAEDNVDATVGDEATAHERLTVKSSIQATIAAGTIACGLELIGMGLGFTLFFAKLNFFQVCLHFLSGVYVSQFIIEAWRAEALWRIVLLCNLPTLLGELSIWFAIFVLRTVPFARHE